MAARGRDPARAARDLAAHAAWRASYIPNGRALESEVQPEIEQGKVFVQGPDRKGHAVVILDAGKHFPR